MDAENDTIKAERDRLLDAILRHREALDPEEWRPQDEDLYGSLDVGVAWTTPPEELLYRQELYFDYGDPY